MREAAFMLFVLVLALVVIAAGYWFILQRLARFLDASLLQAFDALFRPDLDKAKLTHPRVNLIYRHLMRGSAKRGPNKEFLPLTRIEVRMPEEDFRFAQDNGGILEFVRQLAEYRHTLARKKGWIDPAADPVPLRFTMSSDLRRLRPRLVLTHTPHVHSETKAFVGAEGTSGGAVPPTAHKAAVRYDAKSWELSPSKAPYTFGRSMENDIHTNFGEISSRHGEFRFDGDRWKLVPLKTVNPTKVNGAAITSPTRLRDGDTITVGDSGPISFTTVFNTANHDQETDKLPF